MAAMRPTFISSADVQRSDSATIGNGLLQQ